MSALDYNRIGEARIRAERAEARAERLEQLGDRMAMLLRGLGPSADQAAREWEQSRLWDGCPEGPKGTPGAGRKGAKP